MGYPVCKDVRCRQDDGCETGNHGSPPSGLHIAKQVAPQDGRYARSDLLAFKSHLDGAGP